MANVNSEIDAIKKKIVDSIVKKPYPTTPPSNMTTMGDIYGSITVPTNPTYNIHDAIKSYLNNPANASKTTPTVPVAPVNPSSGYQYAKPTIPKVALPTGGTGIKTPVITKPVTPKTPMGLPTTVTDTGVMTTATATADIPRGMVEPLTINETGTPIIDNTGAIVSGGNNPPAYDSVNILDLLNKQAESTYGQAANSLKGRVADIISKYTGQLNKVEGEYRPSYQANDQAKYQVDESTKSVLAKSGLLGSGVELGNIKQNGMDYNMATQGIDLQKQGRKDDLGNQITDAQVKMEYDLQDLDLQKQNYINAGSLQEAKDVRSMTREDYWKDREADLGDAQFAFQKDSFKQTMDYNYTQLADNRDQFAKTYGLEVKKYDTGNEQWNKSFTEDSRQFDKQMGFEEKKFAADMKLENAKFAATLAQNKFDRGMAIQNFALEKQQFAQDLKDAAINMGLKNVSVYEEENSRIDNAITNSILDESMSREFVEGLVSTSMLSNDMKKAKMTMINNAYSKATDPKQEQKPFNPSGTGAKQTGSVFSSNGLGH